MKKFIIFLSILVLSGLSTMAFSEVVMHNTNDDDVICDVKALAYLIGMSKLENQDASKYKQQFENLGGKLYKVSNPYTMLQAKGKSNKPVSCVHVLYTYKDYKYVEMACKDLKTGPLSKIK